MAETANQRRARQARERAEAKKQALGVSSLVYSPTAEAEKVKAEVGDLTSKERAQKLTSGDITKEQFQVSAGKLPASSGASAVNLTDTQRTAQERMAQAKGDTIKTLGDVQASATQRKQDTLTAQQTAAQQEGARLAEAYTSGGEKGLRSAILEQHPRKEGETVEQYNIRVGNLTKAAKSRASKDVTGKVVEQELIPASETKFPTVADYTNEETGEVDWQGLYQAQVRAETQKKQTEEEEIVAAGLEKEDEFMAGVDLEDIPTRGEIMETEEFEEEYEFLDDEMKGYLADLEIDIQRAELSQQREEEKAERIISQEKEALESEIQAARMLGKSTDYIQSLKAGGKESIDQLYRDFDIMRESNELTMTQLMNNRDKLELQGEKQLADFTDNYISNVQTQYQEANQAAYDRQWEQYKYQQEQNWKAYSAAPEMFDFQTINGKVQLKTKSASELAASQAAAQYGLDLDYIQKVKDTFGEDSTIGQAMIMDVLSDSGYNVTSEMLFPQSKDDLLSQLATIQQFGDISPEGLKKLAAAGEIFGKELDAQEIATLETLSQAITPELTGDYQVVQSDGVVYSFDKVTGKLTALSQGTGINNLSTNSWNSVQTNNILAPNAKVNTVYANGEFNFGEATDRKNGKQCGGYVNDVAGTSMGDTFESKIKFVPEDPNSETGYNMNPIAGGYFVMDIGQYGHTGMVKAVTDEGIYITDYNWGKDANGNPQPNETRRDTLIKFTDPEYKFIKGFGATGVNTLEEVQGFQPQVISQPALGADLQNLIDVSESQSDLEKRLNSVGASENQIRLATYTFAQKEAGEQLTPEEELIVGDLAPIHPLWQGGKTSDNDMKRIERDILLKTRQGQSTEQILLGNLNEKGQQSSDIALNLLTLASGSDDFNNKRGIQLPINQGKPVQAMVNVENELLKTVDGQLKNTNSAKTLVAKSDRVLELLNEVPAHKLGAFDATQQKYAKIAGLTDEETLKTQQLETAIVALFNEVRRESLGTAVTETELEFLKPLLASISDQPEILETKIDEFKNSTLSQYNQYRTSVNLPEVNEAELLNSQDRLNLYREQTPQRQALRQYGEEAQQLTGVSSLDIFQQAVQQGLLSQNAVRKAQELNFDLQGALQESTPQEIEQFLLTQ